MNKILKYVLLTAGGIGAVLIAVVAYVAATFNPNDYKPQIVQLVKEKLDRTLKIGGDIKLTFFPALGADLGRLSLSEHASDKEFAAVETVRVAFQLMPLLSREVVVSQIEVRGLRANLVKYKNGTTNVDDLTGSEARNPKRTSGGDDKPARKPMQFNIDHVLIENTTLSYVDEGSGAKYTLNKLNLKTGRIAAATPSDIELAATIDASQPKVNIDVHLRTRLAFIPDGRHFKLDGLDFGVTGEAAGMNLVALSIKGGAEGDAKAIKAGEIVLELDAKQGDNTIKGKLTTPLAVDLGAETCDLRKLIANLVFTDPKSPRGPVTINIMGAAHADMRKQSASLDFSARFDESSVTGKAGLAHFSPPSYVFDVNVDKLDVDRYTDAKKPEGQPAAASKGAANKPEQALDFSALKTLRANGSVRIGSLKAANLKAQNVRLEAKAGGGRLDLNPLTASLYQGAMNGSMSLVAAATPQIAVKQNLAGISIGPLLKDAVDKDTLEGKGSVTLDVSGQGATVSAIKKALNGSASLDLTDGALKGINIGETIRNARARLGTLKGETTQASNAAEKTDFTELKATFAIKNGIAHNSDLSMKSPLLRLGGEGDINIGTDSVDYSAKATLVATAAGQGGKDTSELKGLTVPVRISGPFTSLSYKLDFNAMISGAAQEKIEKKKEEVKSKLQDKLKDRMKGLFGR
ncbi:MAG: AsmA family protein [Burkholderiales bacterium]